MSQLSSRSRRRSGLLILSVVGAFAFFAIGAAGSLSAARSTTRPAGPAVLSLAAGSSVPVPLPASGAPVVLTARVSGAASCTFRAQRTPFSSRYTLATVPCRSGRASFTAPPIANLHQTQLDVHYTVVARRAGSAAAVGSVSVAELGQPGPHTTPVARIDASPDASTTEIDASFAFSSPTLGANFLCSLDQAAFVSCRSPVTYAGQQIGSHNFRVEATRSELIGPAATVSWTITDTTTTTTPTTPTTPSGPVASAPLNTVPPTINGTTNVGDFPGASPGSWDGYPAPDSTLDFLACPNATMTVDGVLADTYGCRTFDISDVDGVPAWASGSYVYAWASATNSSGTVYALSAPSAVVVDPAAPANFSISFSGDGTAIADGQDFLTATVTITNSSGAPLAGQTVGLTTLYGGGPVGGLVSPSATTISPASAVTDSNGQAVFQVSSTEAGNWVAFITVGSTINDPDFSDVGSFAAVPAVNLTLPTISGNAVVGQTLTIDPGTWSPAQSSFQYIWLRCDTSGTVNAMHCGSLDPNDDTYQVVSADVGHMIGAYVGSADWSGMATTAATAVVTAAVAPENVVYPSLLDGGQGGGTITGPQVGDVLIGTLGTWSGAPTPAVTSYWAHSNPNGSGRVHVAEDGILSYTVQASDVGKMLIWQVTATNSVNFASAGSQSGTVAAAPVNLTLPSVNVGGSTFTANPGTWSGYPAPSFSYQWQACTGMDGTGCTVVAGQTSSTLDESLAPPIGSVIVTVTASNGIGSPAVAASNPANYA